MTQNTLSHNPPRGMRDFYPEDMRLRNEIFSAWHKSSEIFGFEPYDSCVVESLDVLKRKSGEEIVEQIYTFTDKSGRELALRPEMTPTLARMVAARQNALSFPIKWYTIAQCFRYERMTKGRKREHYQWNLDIIGEESTLAETEIIATAVYALKLLGFNSEMLRIHYNSRSLLAELLTKTGIPTEHHHATFLALDKLGKMEISEISKMLQDNGLNPNMISQIFKLMEIKSVDDASAIVGHNSPSIAKIKEFQSYLSLYGIEDFAQFNISVIRGLSYYTGIVFECFDIKREFRAIFGGGRYDNLLSEMGGKKACGVGMGFGDVVIGEIISTTRNNTRQINKKVSIAISYMADNQKTDAVKLASFYRRLEIPVDISLQPEKARNFFSRAGNGRFTHAIYVGPDDIQKQTIRIKNLSTRAEIESPITNPEVEKLQ